MNLPLRSSTVFVVVVRMAILSSGWWWCVPMDMTQAFVVVVTFPKYPTVSSFAHRSSSSSSATRITQKFTTPREEESTESSTTIQSFPPFLRTNTDDIVGVMAPTGFWDPLHLSENITAVTYEHYRTAEVKHGRVAMLCVIGYVVPEIDRFPGEIAPGLSFQSIPHGVAAIDAIPALGWMQIIFLIGAVDYYGFLGSFAAGRAPNLAPEILVQRQQSELAHGRLAMLASMELLRHDAQNYVIPNFDGLGNHLITGLPFIYS